MTLYACRLVWRSVGGFLKTFPPPVRVLDESRLRRSCTDGRRRTVLLPPVIARVYRRILPAASVYRVCQQESGVNGTARFRLGIIGHIIIIIAACIKTSPKCVSPTYYNNNMLSHKIKDLFNIEYTVYKYCHEQDNIIMLSRQQNGFILNVLFIYIKSRL